jgi:hypothetical protein
MAKTAMPGGSPPLLGPGPEHPASTDANTDKTAPIVKVARDTLKASLPSESPSSDQLSGNANTLSPNAAVPVNAQDARA